MQDIKENIRQQLYGFYIAYDLWLSNGAKPGGVFSRNYGLCANLFDYLTSIGASSEAALEQLHADFRSAGLNEVLPFNESKGHYYEEKGNNMCHVNPARVAWVRAQIALASLEAEPIGAFHIVEQQVDGTSDYIKDGEWPIDTGIIEVYAASPMTVVLNDVSGPLALAYKELTPAIMRNHIAVFERYGITQNDSITTIHA
ncbi:TPA: hypothetical protein ACYEKW_004796, partial [Escherichia coli]